MKSAILSLLVIAVFAVTTALADAGDKEHKYVGTKMCGMCHKTEKQGQQVDIWKKSKHAEAYQTLLTDKANAFAKERGLTKPAVESPECLQCHVITSPNVDKGLDMKDGVQCETCHGPGSEYKSITIMKDKAKSIAAGLTEFKDDAAIEKACRKCHNEKSPSYKEFKFDERWAKIKHPVPAKP